MRSLAVLVLALCLGLAACNGEPPENGLLQKAQQAYASGLYLEAEGLYEEYLQHHPAAPERWEAWSRLLDIVQTVKGDNDKAKALLEAMILEFGGQPRRVFAALLRMGDIHAQESQWRKAAEAWQKAEGLGEAGGPGGRCAVLLRLGRAYRSLSQYDLARDWLHGCMADVDGSCRQTCRYELAQTWYFSGNWQEARAVLEPLVTDGDAAGEEASVAAFLLADVYQNLGETAKARALLTSILASHPNPKAVEVKLDQLPKE
jgi:tetratricopeptide (TPR) repeat protein